MELERPLSNLKVTDDSHTSTGQGSEEYSHLGRPPHEYMISLFELLSKHFGKSYDEVAEIIADDSALIHKLLTEWYTKFITEKEAVNSVLTEWAQKNSPVLNEMGDRRGGAKNTYPDDAVRFFCFMPFNKYFYPIGFEYDYITEGQTCEEVAKLLRAMKRDYGITLKYPCLPLLGAGVRPYEVELWPMEMMQVSIAVALMLNIV
jgi:hypothetical protein